MGNNATGFRSVRAGLGASLRLNHNQRYVFTEFRDKIVIGDNVGGAAEVSDTNVMGITVGAYQFDIRWEQDMGANNPRNTADGLLIDVDATDNEGFEINLGRTLSEADGSVNTHSNGAFTVGTDPAFFIRVKLDIGTVANSDQITVGFSRGGYPAGGLINEYTDMAVLNVDNGDIKQESRIGAGSNVATDTTDNWTDAQQKVLEVQVSAGGVVAMFVDGAVSTTEMATFTFDDGDVVHAFVSELNDTVDPVVSLMEWESGFLSSIGRDFGVAPNAYNLDNQTYVGV